MEAKAFLKKVSLREYYKKVYKYINGFLQSVSHILSTIIPKKDMGMIIVESPIGAKEIAHVERCTQA